MYVSLVRASFRLAILALGIGLGVGGLVLLMAFALFWSSRIGKLRAIKKLSRTIPWGGNEGVLDVGCGRGPFSVVAASRLTTGVVLSFDLWRKKDVSGNDPSSLMANAEAARSGEKVNPVRGDTRVFPFANGVFDVVISAGSLERLSSPADRSTAVAEMARTLRSGGRIALLITSRAHEYADMLKAMGMKDVSVSLVRLGLFPPGQTITARKPFEAT